MTPRGATETAAANGALALIGEPPIAAIGTPTNAAGRACNAHFGLARDAALAEYPWNFAKAWVTPSKDAVAAPGPLTGRYVLPGDCLVVRHILVNNARAGADTWDVIAAVASNGGAEVESKVLVTNEVAPTVCYTRRVDSVALWDPLFVEAFELHLAQRLAGPLARDPSVLTTLWQIHREKRGDAKRVDAQEGAPKQVEADVPAIRSRRGWRTRAWR